MMGEFFQGWRRKMGVVMLVMAMVFVGGWVRSLKTFDVINCPLGQEYAIAIASWNDSLAIRVGWDKVDSWNEFVWDVSDDDYRGYSDPEFGAYQFDQPIPDGSGCFVAWYLRGYGGAAGVTPLDQRSYRRMLFMIVPYSSVTLPLTLVSLWLLLMQPIKSNQKKNVEPVPAEGA